MNSSDNQIQANSSRVWKPVLNLDGTTNGPSVVADTPDPTDPMQPWKMWDYGLVIINGLAMALNQSIVNGTIYISNPKLKLDLSAALYGLNVALHDVSVAFTNYISSGTPIVVDPPVVGQWPDPSKPTPADLPYFKALFDIMAGSMGILSNLLQAKLDQHPELKAVVDLLDALINAKEDVIAKIEQILSGDAGNPPA